MRRSEGPGGRGTACGEQGKVGVSVHVHMQGSASMQARVCMGVHAYACVVCICTHVHARVRGSVLMNACVVLVQVCVHGHVSTRVGCVHAHVNTFMQMCVYVLCACVWVSEPDSAHAACIVPFGEMNP